VPQVLGVGIIGCGNIAEHYLTLAPMFNGIDVRACADINHEAAFVRAEEFDIDARSVEARVLGETFCFVT